MSVEWRIIKQTNYIALNYLCNSAVQRDSDSCEKGMSSSHISTIVTNIYLVINIEKCIYINK